MNGPRHDFAFRRKAACRCEGILEPAGPRLKSRLHEPDPGAAGKISTDYESSSPFD